MLNDCQIRIAHPKNPRSWLYSAYEGNDWLTLEFTSEVRQYKSGRPLQLECGEQGMDYSLDCKIHLTLPQAKKMKEFLDHFISVEDSNG